MDKQVNKNNFLFNLQNLSLCGPGGHTVSLSLMGAAVTSILWPCAHGNIKNIALPSCGLEDYAGATLGPVAGRLPGASLQLGDKVLPLSANDGPNTLHGGEHNLSRQRWTLTAGGEDKLCAWAELACSMTHGLDGFPGERHFTARYTLSEDALTVEYSARTDRPTPVSMSNHTYWNLAGDFSADCYDQLLELRADGVLYNDAGHLPFALRPCVGTAFDFFAPLSLSGAMARAVPCTSPPLDSDAGQLRNAHGYNNGFALTPCAPFAARLTNLRSGLRMTMTTNQPYLVVYSGGYLPVPGCALALEAQGKPGAVTPLLEPGNVYRRFIRFSFATV